MFFFFFSQTEEWKQFSAKVTDQLKYKANRNLYHYTSPEGLIGILGNNKLWFTESGCLNDESEGKYIYSLIQNCIETNLTFNIDFSEEVRKQIIENRTIINDSNNKVWGPLTSQELPEGSKCITKFTFHLSASMDLYRHSHFFYKQMPGIVL